MVLVDTSVWIDYFRRRTSKEAVSLTQYVQKDGKVAICGLVRQEVLQGTRDEFTYRRIQRLFDQLDYLHLKEPEHYDKAANIYRELRKKGLTIRAPSDCLIATVAIENDLPLFHNDRDFDKIASCTSLKIFKI